MEKSVSWPTPLMTGSFDASVAICDRVIVNVVEGLEVVVATEHNLVTDFGAIARELGLERFFVSVAGDEMTSDASKKP